MTMYFLPVQNKAGFYGAAIVELEVGAYIFTDNQANRSAVFG